MHIVHNKYADAIHQASRVSNKKCGDKIYAIYNVQSQSKLLHEYKTVDLPNTVKYLNVNRNFMWTIVKRKLNV